MESEKASAEAAEQGPVIRRPSYRWSARLRRMALVAFWVGLVFWPFAAWSVTHPPPGLRPGIALEVGVICTLTQLGATIAATFIRLFELAIRDALLANSTTPAAPEPTPRVDPEIELPKPLAPLFVVAAIALLAWGGPAFFSYICAYSAGLPR